MQFGFTVFMLAWSFPCGLTKNAGVKLLGLARIVLEKGTSKLY